MHRKDKAKRMTADWVRVKKERRVRSKWEPKHSKCIVSWPVVDGVDHFTPGAGSVHCTAIRVCALSEWERERDFKNKKKKKTLSETSLLLVIMSKISGILKGSTKRGKVDMDELIWKNVVSTVELGDEYLDIIDLSKKQRAVILNRLKPVLQPYSRSPPASCPAPWLLRSSWPAPEGWRVGTHPQSSPPPEEAYLEIHRSTGRIQREQTGGLC